MGVPKSPNDRGNGKDRGSDSGSNFLTTAVATRGGRGWWAQLNAAYNFQSTS